MCFMFQTRPFWICMRVPTRKLKNRFEFFFGEKNLEINDYENSKKLLMNIVTTIQNEMVERMQNVNSYDMIIKLCYIFDEIHAFYLEEKEVREQLLELNINNSSVLSTFEENRNITRNIMDACNIWIENCILYQHDIDTMLSQASYRDISMDIDLIIDMYLYGFASQGLSLLSLSQNMEQQLFYGIKVTPKENSPAELLKEHPIIFFNTVLVGNQSILSKVPLTADANDTAFGRGFVKEYGVEFLLFLAALVSFQEDLLHGDEKALTIINKDHFISLVESYTNPRIDGNRFYDSFVLSQDKIKNQLRKKENIVWKAGANKERLELRPFINLEDGNVLISYGVLEQAKQLWISYSANGGMCYSNITDNLSKAMNERNQELSDILVTKIQEVLNKHYTPKFDEKDVKYQRIFGEREINYGDFDVVYYTEKTKELFLIEAKYFSDSLNSSGMVTDYKKLFEKGGYYDHCRRRYNLVLSEPENVKRFIGVQDEISVHLIFLSSKPIELEIQDTDGVVTFLSLGIFEKYIEGKLTIEDGSIVRPVKKI